MTKSLLKNETTTHVDYGVYNKFIEDVAVLEMMRLLGLSRSVQKTAAVPESPKAPVARVPEKKSTPIKKTKEREPVHSEDMEALKAENDGLKKTLQQLTSSLSSSKVLLQNSTALQKQILSLQEEAAALIKNEATLKARIEEIEQKLIFVTAQKELAEVKLNQALKVVESQRLTIDVARQMGAENASISELFPFSAEEPRDPAVPARSAIAENSDPELRQPSQDERDAREASKSLEISAE